jgi:hypothetical protein
LRPNEPGAYKRSRGANFSTKDIAMTRDIRAAVRRRSARRDALIKANLIVVVLAVALAAAYTWLAADAWNVARNRSLIDRPGQSSPPAAKRAALPASSSFLNGPGIARMDAVAVEQPPARPVPAVPGGAADHRGQAAARASVVAEV